MHNDNSIHAPLVSPSKTNLHNRIRLFLLSDRLVFKDVVSLPLSLSLSIHTLRFGSEWAACRLPHILANAIFSSIYVFACVRQITARADRLGQRKRQTNFEAHAEQWPTFVRCAHCFFDSLFRFNDDNKHPTDSLQSRSRGSPTRATLDRGRAQPKLGHANCTRTTGTAVAWKSWPNDVSPSRCFGWESVALLTLPICLSRTQMHCLYRFVETRAIEIWPGGGGQQTYLVAHSRNRLTWRKQFGNNVIIQKYHVVIHKCYK